MTSWRCNSLFAVNDEAGGYYALDPEAGDEVRIDSRAVVSRLQNRGEDYTSHAGTGMVLADFR